MSTDFLFVSTTLLLSIVLSVSGEKQTEQTLSVETLWRDAVTKPSSSNGLLRRVQEWSVEDVALWMNFTIGYPEYSSHIVKHRVDGPVLLSLTAEDFDLYFPIEHGLHIIKLRAHLEILRGKCLCPGSSDVSHDVEFWTLLRNENARMWMLGGTALQFPRVAMLWAYFFDYEGTVIPLMHGTSGATATTGQSYLTVTEEEVAQAEGALRSGVAPPKTLSLGETVTFWLSFLLVPDLFMAYHCGRLFLTNYVVIFFFLFHFILQTYNEFYLVYMYVKGEQIFDKAGLSLLQKFWHLHSWFTLVPAIFVVTGYIAPLLLQQLVVWGLCGHATMVLVGIVIHVITGGPAAPNSEASPGSGNKDE